MTGHTIALDAPADTRMMESSIPPDVGCVRRETPRRNPHGYLFTHPDGRPVRPD
jgi:hypothetical protein